MLSITTALASVPCGFTVPPTGRPAVPKSVPGEPLQVRDDFGVFEAHETEHFAIKWGASLTPDPADLELLATDLEHVWHRQIDVLGWDPPAGSEVYKLNVYLGSTGPNVPEIEFTGGYVWVDSEQFPYIVLSADTLDGYDDPAATWPVELAAHEFNHTLQIRDWAFSGGRYGPYLWEATASWVVPKTLETEAHSGWGTFLLSPHVSLDMWAFESGDTSRDYRQYDTAMFLHYLSDQVGLGHDFIRDAWHEAGEEAEPLEFLDVELEGGLDALYTDFAIQYALEDHELAALYREGMEQAEGWVENQRLTTVVPRDGSDWARPPVERRPESWAWNHILWTAEGPGTVTVRFQPDSEGSLGTVPRIDGYVIRSRAGAHELFAPGTPLDVLPDDKVRLVVVTTTHDAVIDEAFDYEYAFEADIELPQPKPGPSTETVTESAWGCSSVGSSWPVSGLLVLSGALITRRRRWRMGGVAG